MNKRNLRENLAVKRFSLNASTWCLSLCLALALVGCKEPVSRPEPIRPVRALKVGDLTAFEGRDFPSRATSKEEVDLSFQVSGPLIALPVDVGSRVKKGEVVATIDPRDFDAQLESAQSNLAQARANLTAMEKARPEEIERLKAEVEKAEATLRQAEAEHVRTTQLYEQEVSSRSEFDLSQARVERTEAEVKAAREVLNIAMRGERPEDLDAKRAEIRALESAVAIAKNQKEYSVLTAPFDGIVVSRYVDNFQTVQAKEPIVRLVDPTRIELTVQVPESLISLVPQAQKAVCRFDAIPGQEFPGTITKVGLEASKTTRTYPVTVEITQSEETPILPGMAGTMQVLYEGDNQEAGLIIPPNAIFSREDGKETFVWVVDEASQKVSQRGITVQKLARSGLEVTEGLTPGEWVVMAGVNSLREGQQVKLLNAEGK